MKSPPAKRPVPEIRRRKARATRANGDVTRKRILDAAERLFAEHGYTAVSMRSITAEAGVNVAAIHFHFASKEALFEAIFNRRVEPINEQRAAGLHKAMAHAATKPVDIAEVISAFVNPHLGAFDAGSVVLLQFMARAAAEPDKSIQAVLSKQFDPVWHELTKATKLALPNASDEGVNWGLFFVLGALYFVNPSRNWLATMTQGKCDPSDAATALHYLLPFLTGGLKALSEAQPDAVSKKPRKSRR